MNSNTIKKYGGYVRLLDIETEVPADWDLSGATHVRVSLPAGRNGQAVMEARGFVFGDRTLDVEIRPLKTKIDYSRLVRIKLEAVRDHSREILDIALAAFPFDRRFHLAPDYEPKVAKAVLEALVAELDEVLICHFKGEMIGFLALREVSDKKVSVYLAAVAEKSRASGAGLSLYAGAVDRAAKLGFEVIEGRISSLNTPVINMYAFLGGTFANPRDVYLKVM
ncbi:MAG: GNAT family N-acetyltransferase [Deltaproteobacteria bacterium]|jgi:hypothetical protein|nr:GNAT family N-acetyltransferase [Deltaproteobacteria bacterium]